MAAIGWLVLVLLIAAPGCGGRGVRSAPLVDQAEGGGPGTPPIEKPRRCTCATECQNGYCVEVLASELHAPGALAVSDTEVYFTSNLGIMKVSKSGGAASVLFPTTEGRPGCIALDGSYLYWSASFDSQVWRASLVDLEPELVAHDQGHVAQIAIAATGIYWSDWQHGKIMVLRRDGSGIRMITDATKQPGELAVDATHIYWAEEISDEGAVISLPLTGGQPTPLAAGQNAPRGLAISPTHVYWTTREALSRVTLDGGEPELLAEGPALPERVLLDEAFAYWIGSYGVQKTPLNGGTTEELPGSEFSHDLALDERSVYFTNDGVGFESGNGTLVKVTPK